jgi:MoxR-like ATPase
MEDPAIETEMIERAVAESSIDRKAAPIVETGDAISYLGVRLEKASGPAGLYVPNREQYKDYINDKFSLDLQKEIAVSFLQGDPILVEGGTSIGKTTTVRKMAADLGWEVHYANLNGATDVEDLMGRYIPNPNKHSPNDPEYVFADGKVTSGLRQEEGKTKVIILDEFNAAAPNILIRLHEVLDAIGRGENVVLSEDASEVVPVDKTKTKIVALMNPPGKGYFGREPLDPAQLRRWVYTKAPTDLPDETFSHATDALFTLAPQIQDMPESAYLLNRDLALLPEQLQEIPGIHEVLAKYKEFHRGAKQLVKERRVAADQPQPFTYDDRMEPRRVRDFVLSFYNGDVNDTFQTALRYYYANKLDSQVDKAALEELIRQVEYREPIQNVTSQRRGLDRDVNPMAPDVLSPESTPDTASEQRKWQEILGTRVEVKPLPAFVSPEVRRNLEAFGFELIYLPKLNLETRAYLQSAGESQYLDDLQRRYPNWRHYESIDDIEESDPKITRNLNEWFWGHVKDGNINFPNLQGQWVAVEKMPKPAYRETYESTPVGARLGFRDRFNVSWDDVKVAVDREKGRILADMGLRGSSADLRMPDALEWNLMANREGWGATNTYEWTNTEYRDAGASRRVCVGRSGRGGAAYAFWGLPSYSGDRLGFRLAVYLGT